MRINGNIVLLEPLNFYILFSPSFASALVKTRYMKKWSEESKRARMNLQILI